MSSNLILHSGGWQATREQVGAVPLPGRTESYQPVGHIDLLDTLVRAGAAYGWQPQRERLALARQGQQFFGIVDFQRNGAVKDGIGFSVGARNAYDKSMSVGILGGGSVTLCDNLMLAGEWCKEHKHTPGVWDQLYSFLFGQLGKLGVQHDQLLETCNAWRVIGALSQRDSDHLLMSLVRRETLPCSDLPKVLKEFDRPTVEGWNDEPRNPWRLYNAFTQVSKDYSPLMQLERVRQAHEVFVEVLA